MNNQNKCQCGRSPTGFCQGWHNLSEKDYLERRQRYEASKSSTEIFKPALNEAKHDK